MLHLSTTLYVGNLSFYTTEEQLYELFGRAGDVKKIIMGLDKFKKTPCGFCFVEYFTRSVGGAFIHWGVKEMKRKIVCGVVYTLCFLCLIKVVMISFVLSVGLSLTCRKLRGKDSLWGLY